MIQLAVITAIAARDRVAAQFHGPTAAVHRSLSTSSLTKEPTPR